METEIDSYQDRVTHDWKSSPSRRQTSPRLPPSPAPRRSIESKSQTIYSPEKSEVKSQNLNSPSRLEVKYNSITNDVLLRQPPCPAPRTSIEVKGHNLNQSPQKSEVKRSPAKKCTEENIVDNDSDTCTTPQRTTPDQRKLSKQKLLTNSDKLTPSSSPRPERKSTDSPSKPSKAKGHAELKGHGSPSTMRHPELPPVIRDPKTNEMYKRGRLLGKVRTQCIFSLHHHTMYHF